MKHVLILLVSMVLSTAPMHVFAQQYSCLYFGNIPIHVNVQEFMQSMKSNGFRYKGANGKYNQIAFSGRFITNADTIIAEYSFKNRKVGKVTVIVPFTNYESIVSIYTAKYGNPIFANNDVIYNTGMGQISISYDDTSIIITYFDRIGYSEITDDIYNAI